MSMRAMIALCPLLLAGCGTISSVHGWAGGPVRTGVENDTVVVRYEAPRPGWSLTVDRSKVDGDTVVLWMSAHGAMNGPLDRTAITVTWQPAEAASVECAQINIKLPGEAKYLPAAVGCGPMSD
ncbi:MAG: hypothetical protein P8M32_00245 [Phycisphaerales bacterium]|nr:hypothetical protein [Phycisphaerales bacterium]